MTHEHKQVRQQPQTPFGVTPPGNIEDAVLRQHVEEIHANIEALSRRKEGGGVTAVEEFDSTELVEELEKLRRDVEWLRKQFPINSSGRYVRRFYAASFALLPSAVEAGSEGVVPGNIYLNEDGSTWVSPIKVG